MAGREYLPRCTVRREGHYCAGSQQQNQAGEKLIGDDVVICTAEKPGIQARPRRHTPQDRTLYYVLNIYTNGTRPVSIKRDEPLIDQVSKLSGIHRYPPPIRSVAKANSHPLVITAPFRPVAFLDGLDPQNHVKIKDGIIRGIIGLTHFENIEDALKIPGR